MERARRGAFQPLSRQREGPWSGPFFFIQLTDTQLGMIRKDESWEEEMELFSRAVEQINRLKPRFVIHCGDLVNQLPGGDAYPAQVAEFQRIAGSIDASTPFLCVPGNHDMGDRPTPATLAAYRQSFGDDWFSFWAGGVCCLVLNSNLYWDPTGAPEEQERQEAWFASALQKARDLRPQHILVFQHHPWFLERPDDPDQYFTIPRLRRDPALALMRQAGVRAVISGHYHRNAYASDGELEMITTGPVGMPLGQDPSGLRIVKVYEDRIEHAYYGLDKVPEAVSLRPIC